MNSTSGTAIAAARSSHPSRLGRPPGRGAVSLHTAKASAALNATSAAAQTCRWAESDKTTAAKSATSSPSSQVAAAPTLRRHRTSPKAARGAAGPSRYAPDIPVLYAA